MLVSQLYSRLRHFVEYAKPTSNYHLEYSYYKPCNLIGQNSASKLLRSQQIFKVFKALRNPVQFSSDNCMATTIECKLIAVCALNITIVTRPASMVVLINHILQCTTSCVCLVN